jgi:hypothetical protein
LVADRKSLNGSRRPHVKDTKKKEELLMKLFDDPKIPTAR